MVGKNRNNWAIKAYLEPIFCRLAEFASGLVGHWPLGIHLA